tara:strand:+ start:282 stop:716 length:435 start_codon:yes stop_codon:yes gene_type:complete
MKKLDKQISENIDSLVKLMEKNDLKELDISDGKFSYRLKKNSNEIKKQSINQKIDNSIVKQLDQKKPETSLKSPLVGTAYLSPEPGSKQFIEVGQNVKIGQVLLIIEAMKTMNEIVADRNGTVKKIYIKNEAPVEFGEPLVLIE